jgi:L-fuculose-phosphate aldolase
MLTGELVAQLTAAGSRLAAAGLVRASEGNLSVRIDSRRCLVTPAGGVTGRLSGADLVEVPLDGAPVSAWASSEVHLHIEVYRRRPDVGAVVHAHPPRVVQLARAGHLPDPRLLEADERLFGQVLQVAHLEEGSRALAMAVGTALANSVACVLLDHGAVTVGETVESALRRMLFLERAAARSGAP